NSAIGNQVLVAIEDEVIALALVSRSHLQWVAAGVGLGQAKGEDLLPAAGSGQVAALQVFAAPGEDGVLADGGVAREEGANAGALAADARQGAGIGDGIRPASAVLDRHRHAEDVVLASQRQHVVVEKIFDVAKLLNRSNLLAERLDVVQELLLVGRVHGAGL